MKAIAKLSNLSTLLSEEMGMSGTASGFGDYQVERRDVWWVKNLRCKTRPALVVSSDRYNLNPRNYQFLVVPLYTLRDGALPRTDEVGIYPPEGGLFNPSVTKVTCLQPVKREQLVNWMGCVSEELMEAVEDALRACLCV